MPLLAASISPMVVTALPARALDPWFQVDSFQSTAAAWAPLGDPVNRPQPCSRAHTRLHSHTNSTVLNAFLRHFLLQLLSRHLLPPPRHRAIMAPRRSVRTPAVPAPAPAAAPSPSPSPPPQKMPYPLRGCRIAVSGAIPGLTHEDVLAKAKALGAATTQNVTTTVTHLITTQQEVDDVTPKVRQSIRHGKVKMVSMDWLEECEAEGQRLSEDDYELKKAAEVKAEPDVAVASSSTSSSAAPTANGKKRAAAAAPAARTPATKKGKKNGELVTAA